MRIPYTFFEVSLVMSWSICYIGWALQWSARLLTHWEPLSWNGSGNLHGACLSRINERS